MSSTLGFIQETTCDDLLKKVQINICCVDELSADTNMVTALFLHQYSSYNVLSDTLQLLILNDKDVVTTNHTPDLLCSCL
jgi:hypothetical protein